MAVNLQGARVLLTGATGGIGHAIARALHAKGADLVLTGRRTEVLAPLADELGATALAADLSDPAALATLLERTGHVDVLVANAALPAVGLLGALSIDDIDRNLDVNLRTPIMMCRELFPAMVERGSGQLVLIGSVSGLVASPGSSMYSATKFGLRGFASALRQDLHGTGVGVSIVEPGFVSDAGMFVNSGMEVPGGVRLVSPEKVARGVVRAIERDKGEVVVAPSELKLGARLGQLAPGLNARVQRAAGAADIVGEHRGGE